MKGKLTDQPLAELIREISSKNLSGTLRLEHDRARTAVYFEDGQLVYAASNVRTLRAREYLTSRGLVSENELARLGNNLSDLSLTNNLVANGTLSQEQIDGLRQMLVTDILRVSLLWTEGTWEFDDRARLDDQVNIQPDINNLLREAAHRLPAKFVSLRFRNPNEVIFRATEVDNDSNFLPAESFILSRLDSPTRVDELVSISGLNQLDAQRVIYGLALSSRVKREYWHYAFRADAAKSAKEVTEVSGAAQVTAGQPAGSTRWEARDDEIELESFLERLAGAVTYYEVMDLPRTATADEVKDAYYSLARRYHPDRFHLKSGTSLHANLSSAFARITQAYETLTDDTARSAYDASLERARNFADSAPKQKDRVTESVDDFDVDLGTENEAGQAEYNFREGVGALQQKRINAAINHLAAAAREAPDEARYRAYYGRALAATERTRRLAENEIQAAVKLDPSNALYRTMLAELYFDLKFHRRAQTELERALAIDPNNASAQLLQRKLTRSQKIG
ncbi:MAG: DnaJ domain-containing protein [Acidobacteriota bacterium]|nr:DnaJ domain-containing protein [Acidobacteriota bacterium]